MAEVQKYSSLVLITNSFPFGGITEENFVIPELEALCSRFSRVVIFPTIKSGAQFDCKLPENLVVDSTWIDHPDWTQKWRRIRFLFNPSVIRSNKRFSDLTFAVAAHAFAGVLKSWIEKNGVDISKTLFYTFWFDFPAAALSILAKSMGVKYISRAHGHDIYANRAADLRREAVARSSGVFCAGDAGAEYLKREMPDLNNKIATIRLGSTKRFPEAISACHNADEENLTFLSVARVDVGKRVDLNFKLLRALAIARPSTTIRWIHIGDGPLMADLRRVVSSDAPKNLIVELKGALRNEHVQQIYTSEPIDWTMLLSDGEGLPIAVCESLSYGVPVVATMVRGTDEIVDDDCGLPLPDNPEPEEFVRGILPYLDSPVRFQRLRNGAVEHWNKNFNAATLRPEFAEFLLSI